MSDPQSSAASPELTPEARAIMGRARRSFLISIGILILGFLAVGGALIYRATTDTSKPASGSDYVIAALKVPQDAQIISAVAADGKLTVTFKAGSMTSVRIFDGKTGAMLREIPVLSD